MGTGSFTTQAYRSSAGGQSVMKSTSYREVYKGTEIDAMLNPKGVIMRESRDSEDNPSSTPIIIALDVTGSMGSLAHKIAKSLPELMEKIHESKLITNPHIMFMAVGDVQVDRAPLQVSQFEADLRIAEQLQMIYFENGGGGNDSESYTLPWYFAVNHTSLDSLEKRGLKGFLFTLGDEPVNETLSNTEIERVMGYMPEKTQYSKQELLKNVREKYHVCHIDVRGGKRGRERWNFLGEDYVTVTDYSEINDLIVRRIESKKETTQVTEETSATGNPVVDAIGAFMKPN